MAEKRHAIAWDTYLVGELLDGLLLSAQHTLHFVEGRRLLLQFGGRVTESRQLSLEPI